MITSYIINSETQCIEVKPNTDSSNLGVTRHKKLLQSTISRLPSSKNEVAINGLFADLMLKADFFDSQYENSSEAIYVEKVDDIIGRKLANELTVVGIYFTDDGIYDFMEALIDLDDEE